MATIRDGSTALVVIDVQNDVMKAAWDRDGVVARIATLIDRARNEDVPVIFVQHEDEEMQPGTDGWQYVQEIAPREDDIVIAKQYPDSFADTVLEQALEDLGVSHLVIAGAQSMACIRVTSHRALAEGYDLTLVADAHTTDDLDYQGVTLTAEQIVGYTNLCVQFTSYPGQESRVTPHDSVSFTTSTNAQNEDDYVHATS